MSPSEWKGEWISGPQRTERPITLAQAQADDACGLQCSTTLFQAASAGDRILRVPSVTGSAPARPSRSTTLPATVKTWSAPVSNGAVAIEFKQSIGANDALRTGTYSKTLTFTLSTTTP